MSNVKLIWITPDCEKIIGYCARVSNPKNQANPSVSKLLKYCIDHKHWSIFEMGNMCVEIITSRAISTQILRHRSFSFQEFSLRYAVAADLEFTDARLQDEQNRQNSINEGVPDTIKLWWKITQEKIWREAYYEYQKAIEAGIAKELARMLLPLGTQTKLYMNGSIRSWVHYIELRTDKETQYEHRVIANAAKNIFIEQLPIISEALEWKQ